MNNEITAYPLAWPAGWTRTKIRSRANFGRRVDKTYTRGDGTTGSWKQKEKLTIADSRDRLRRELELLGATAVIISSNLRLRSDGQPMSAQREPEDPGICVYFRLNKMPRCLPCDRWDRTYNLAAIAKYVDALRGQLRWGVGSADVAFAGFKALPGSGDAIVMPARMSIDEAARFIGSIVGVTSDAVMDGAFFQNFYRAGAKKLHPDVGGDASQWSKFQQAADLLKAHHGI